MPQQINPLTLLLLVLFLGIMSFLTFSVWRWAMRHPAPATTMLDAVEPEPLSYVAIGASDVEGVGADDPSSESWVNALHGMMPPGTRLTRLGRGGITLHEALDVEVPRAVASRPDLMTIWLCVNDVGRGVTLNDYLKELDKALGILTRETGASIYLLNLPDLSLILPSQGDPQQLPLIQGGVNQWNAGIAATAARFGKRVKIVDIYPNSAEVLDRPDYLSADGFHPSTSGYRRLAEAVWAVIRSDSASRISKAP
ncbi:MAG TPA: SGNH/GDSL hydrolase family protein [Chloroflexia bacterium]|nr:SGNH/GDSL hydrolase family protein [Chloroflexia bacterium]